MASETQQVVEYGCPGEAYPISRAVHLGRLARFYPGCRQCPHRDATDTLSARQVEQLAETRWRGLSRPLFHDEGAGGVYLNDLGPAEARDAAAALGVFLQRQAAVAAASPKWTPVVAIAGDGRAPSSELVAAVGEGLRWAGCHVVDIGPASAACLAWTIDHLRTAGGMLVGNPGDRPHTVGLKFWDGGPRPFSAGGLLDPLRQIYQNGVDRPRRAYGSLRRFQADAPYLAGLATYYHALRPLRFVLDTSCGPIARYLKKLTEWVACRIVPCRTTLDGLSEQVLAEKAHFAIRIDDDGETCRVLDERGRRVPTERMVLLLARYLLVDQPQGVIVLEEGTSPDVARQIEVTGGRIVISNARRAEMAVAMRAHGALVGGGGSGRFWYARGGAPLPDALMTLTLLLVILSQSDRRFSEVLDTERTLR